MQCKIHGLLILNYFCRWFFLIRIPTSVFFEVFTSSLLLFFFFNYEVYRKSNQFYTAEKQFLKFVAYSMQADKQKSKLLIHERLVNKAKEFLI